MYRNAINLNSNRMAITCIKGEGERGVGLPPSLPALKISSKLSENKVWIHINIYILILCSVNKE